MKSLQEQLDFEHEGRISELSHQVFDKRKIAKPTDFFSHKDILETIDKPKVVLSGFNTQRILSSYPFVSDVYVLICPKCSCVKKVDDLMPLLDNQIIKPILTGRYSYYPENFVKKIIRYPHVSFYEFDFYRWNSLFNAEEKIMCEHCFDIRRKKLRGLLKQKNYSKGSMLALEDFISNFSPAIYPDLEMVDLFERAVKKNDLEMMSKIHAFSMSVYGMRTIQAFKARSSMDFDSALQFSKQASPLFLKNNYLEIKMVEDAISDHLFLDIPQSIDPVKFVKLVEPHRKQISKIAENLTIKSDDKNSLTTLSSRLAQLGGDMQRISKSKRYSAYRASVAFVKGNKTLIASALVASAFGVATGKLLGCAVGAGGGIALEIAKKFNKKVLVPAEVTEFVEDIKKTLDPHARKLLSFYLNADINAVQLWDIKNKLSKR